MKSFKDTTVYVVGGSSGIGFALAECLASQQARVGLIGSSPEKLARARTHIGASGSVVATARLDIRDEYAWTGALAELESNIGPPDSLFLNAGVGSGSTAVEAGPSSVWRWIWEVNVLGTVYGLRACLPGMRARARPGHILITSSIAGLVHPPGLGPYTVSKAALIGLAGTLREELRGTALGVSALIPSAVRTDFSSTSSRQAPADFRDEVASRAFSDIAGVLQSGLDPRAVAPFVLERIAAGAYYICTHSDFRALIAADHQELLDSIPARTALNLP
jgi:NAD(P)-dependent dehydrogenase (short-subunit alcohol dehydrogenase family)